MKTRIETLLRGTITFICMAYVCFFVLSDYRKNWYVGEFAIHHAPFAYENGTAFKLEDLVRSLDYENLNSTARTRFLSNFVTLLNSKFRVWLWNWVPPHPSFSLTWVLNIVSLLLLFRFMMIWTASRYAAWASSLLFGVSAGYLSQFTQYFHPAKALTLFFIVLFFNLYAELERNIHTNGSLQRKDWRKFLWSLPILFLAFFSDETAFSINLLIPAVFLSFFVKGEKRLLRTCLFFLPALVFLLFVFLVVPILWERLGFGYATLWSEAFTAERNPGFASFRPIWIIQNLISLLKAHFVLLGKDTWVIWKTMVAVAIATYMAISLRSLSKTHRMHLLKLAVATLFFLSVMTVIHSKHLHVLPDAYYYGVIFGLFYCMFVGLLLSNGNRGLAIGNTLMVGFFAFVLLQRFEIATNRIIKAYTVKNMTYECKLHGWPLPDTLKYMNDEETVSFPKVYALWKDRDSREAVIHHSRKLPGSAYGMVMELNQTQKGARRLIVWNEPTGN